jgi:hypothetical protein
MMRGSWVTLPLVKSPLTDPINTKRVTDKAPGHLVDEIARRYTHGTRKPPFWDLHGPRICDEILSIKTDLLWEFNFRLILLVRDLLGIQTPLTFSRPAASVIQAFHGPMAYLSGAGGRSYMGDLREFKEADIPVIWSQHQPVTGDSILSVLFDFEDPMSVVLAEKRPQEGEADNIPAPRNAAAEQKVCA